MPKNVLFGQDIAINKIVINFLSLHEDAMSLLYFIRIFTIVSIRSLANIRETQNQH